MGTQIRSEPVDTVVGRLAAQQHGVVARRQLIAAGVSEKAIEHRLRTRRLIPLHRGVYAVGHPRLTVDGRRLAAVLAAGDGAALSHRDAAALHGLGGWASSSAVVEVTTPADVRATPRLRVHGRRRLVAADRAVVSGIPVTSVARTLVDLASVVSGERLAAALTAAEQQRLLDVRAIEAARLRVHGRHGRGDVRLRAALAEHAARGAQLTRSELEERLRRLVREYRLGRPRLNAWIPGVAVGGGGGGVEVDALWPQERVVVEADGWRWHLDRTSFARDREKANRLQLAGYVVLRFTHDDVVRRPARTAAAIRAALDARSLRISPPMRGGDPQ